MDVAGFELSGYSRGGPVFNPQDGVKGNLSLGGELQKFRLGNEGDNGIEVNFARGFEANGIQWKVNYMPAKWGSGDISTEQAFVEMSGFPFAPEAKFWDGQRRLRRPNATVRVHRACWITVSGSVPARIAAMRAVKSACRRRARQ